MRSILGGLDVEAVSEAARRETRNREIHLPPTGVYRWWARRTEAVFGELLDLASVALERSPLDVVDPFAGGGVIPFAAVRRGHRIHGQDIDPWAAAGLDVALSLPPRERLERAANGLARLAAPLIRRAYGTHLADGAPAEVAHTLRVAIADCTGCGAPGKLFPHATVTALRRKDRGGDEAWLACPRGHLFRGLLDYEGPCPRCGVEVEAGRSWLPRRRATCLECGRTESLSERSASWRWEVVLVERVAGRRRELGPPGTSELGLTEGWEPRRELGEIPRGQETQVLLRHGFERWDQLYPDRQRAVTEELLDRVDALDEDRDVRAALRMAVLGTAEMAGHLSRWDRWYLKSYESMAGHRFNLTTLSVEPNVWGTATAGRGTLRRRLRLLYRAADWLHACPRAITRVARGSSEALPIADGSIDLVLTDPPYHDDVQYSELSLPLRAWAGLSTQTGSAEAVAGAGRPRQDYRRLMTGILAEARRVLRGRGRLVLSYANRDPEAWADLFQALQESGFGPVACAAVHSENEGDQVKRGVRSCTLDLLLELAPGPVARPARVRIPQDGLEPAFLRTVAGWFGRIGSLEGGWREELAGGLRASAFLA